MTIDELCRRHRRVALDTNLFVCLFEIEGPLARTAVAVLDAVSTGRITGITSALTLTEVILGPIVTGDETLAERYIDAIRSVDHLHIVPVTAEIAADAGFVRARTGMTLADSVHVATAILAGASVLLTNDRRIRPTPRMEVVQLSGLAPA